MGQDFAQWNNWDIHKSLDWHLLGEASNEKIQNYIRDLMYFYRGHKVLYETDYDIKKQFNKILVNHIIYEGNRYGNR